MNLIVGILYKLMSFCERLPNLCWDHSLNLSPWPCHPCPHPHLCRVFDVFGGVLAACCVHVIKESPTMWKSQGELLLRSYLNFDMDGHDQTTACFSRSPASGAYSKKNPANDCNLTSLSSFSPVSSRRTAWTPPFAVLMVLVSVCIGIEVQHIPIIDCSQILWFIISFSLLMVVNHIIWYNLVVTIGLIVIWWWETYGITTFSLIWWLMVIFPAHLYHLCGIPHFHPFAKQLSTQDL